MKLNVHPLCIAFTLATTHSMTVYAQSLRCKGDLAMIGDSKASILQKCGEPILKDSFCKPAAEQLRVGDSGGAKPRVLPCEVVDEWSYNPGYGQFITTLRFEGGELKFIKYGDRIK